MQSMDEDNNKDVLGGDEAEELETPATDMPVDDAMDEDDDAEDGDDGTV
jgi:hypothetical protein